MIIILIPTRKQQKAWENMKNMRRLIGVVKTICKPTANLLVFLIYFFLVYLMSFGVKI